MAPRVSTTSSGLVGRIDDPEFGPAFLAIWLDPRSIVRDLRVQLLGDSDGQAVRKERQQLTCPA